MTTTMTMTTGTTMTTTETTTEPSQGPSDEPSPSPSPDDTTVPGARRPWHPRWWRDRLSRVSVRTRIALSVAVLTGWTLAASGLLVWTLESRAVQHDVYDNIAQETQELFRLQYPESRADSSNPGPPAYDSAEELLEVFLTRNVPDDDELFVGWWSDDAKLTTGHPLGEATLGDDGFRPAVRELLPEGGSARRSVSGIGDYLLTVQPLTSTTGDRADAMVVVSYLDAERDELTQTMQTYAGVSLLLLLGIVALAWFQAGRLLKPLRALHANAEEINATDLSRRLPVATSDDIGRLTHTYNAMLDRLQQGFVSQRQFLDDAGHELRTPLTVLRGHLELVDPTDAREVEETTDLLLDEVDRMSRLVDELILLAKSDRPDFVRRAPTSLTGLLEQVHRKAGALSAARDWRLGELPPESLSALVDEQRITQALLQLCDNAVKHTSAGDRITLAGTVHHGVGGGTVRLTVTDTGQGVEPEARERIFDRFGRAHVPEGDEGFGLGLSIVRAIAEAHDGRVWVEDGPGGGARFVIELSTEQGSNAWHGS